MTAFSRQSADKSQQLIGRMFVLALSLLLPPLFAAAQSMTDQHMNHLLPTTDSAETQDWAKQRLAKSPRHQEWVKVKNGNREVNSFVVYPEVKKKATAVVVIHEIFGMTDWVQSLTDQLAEQGISPSRRICCQEWVRKEAARANWPQLVAMQLGKPSVTFHQIRSLPI